MSAGGGIKINNIKVSGGADGKTPTFKIENGELKYSFVKDVWYSLGKVVGEKGEQGPKGNDGANGKDGAKLVSLEFVRKDEEDGNVYKLTFSDGTTAEFTAPKGQDGLDFSEDIEIIRTNQESQRVLIQSIQQWQNIQNTLNRNIEQEQKSQNYSITRNSNRVTAVENALVKTGTIAKKNGVLVDQTQQTGGDDLLGLTVLDNSYCTVNKIQGNTVVSGNELVNVKFNGIKSTNKNWFNPNLLLVPNGWTENNGVYSGQLGSIYAVYKDTMGGLLKINTSGQVTVSFVGKNETLNQTTFGIGFAYKDGTGTSDAERVWINSTEFAKYSITSKVGKSVDLIYVSFSNGDNIYLKDFCVRVGTDDTYIPYEENSLMLDNAVELGKWDYIQDGKVVKYTKIIELTGNESWSYVTSNVLGHFASMIPTPSVAKSTLLVNNIFPDQWPSEGTLPCLYSPKDTIVVFPNADKNNPTITSLEEWKTYLKDLYDKGTPLTVAYPVETPTETDISANFEYLVWYKGSEQMQLENAEAIPEVENTYYYIIGGEK